MTYNDAMDTAMIQVTCHKCKAHRRVSEAEIAEYVKGHVASCGVLKPATKAVWAEWLKDARTLQALWAECIERIFKITPIRHKTRADGSTSKCGGRCVNARGGDCDCQCLGANHGVYA